MYVCLCKGITDKAIRDKVDAGASSFAQVRRELELASQCGKCAVLARDIYNERVDSHYDDNLFYAA